MVYGEWCGEGIMKGCAVHKLEKMFVVFSVADLVDGERLWLPTLATVDVRDPDRRVYNIAEFGIYGATIDFSDLAASQNQLVELTNAVEAECPVGRAFGVEGIGEGIVWRVAGPEFNSSDFWFKVKGEKHSVSKVKKLAAVDVERVETAKAFVEKTLTENRLEQGLEMLKTEGLPLDRKATGTFLKWIFSDIMKEESDTLEESGLTTKDVSGMVSTQARVWFFKKLDEAAGL